MSTLSVRETVGHAIGAAVVASVVLLGSAAAFGAGVAALWTIAPPGTLDRTALLAAPGLAIAGVAGLLVGVAILLAGFATMALETVASGIRLGLDRSAALDRPMRSLAVGPDRPATAASADRRVDPADWTADRAVERSRAPPEGDSNAEPAETPDAGSEKSSDGTADRSPVEAAEDSPGGRRDGPSTSGDRADTEWVFKGDEADRSDRPS